MKFEYWCDNGMSIDVMKSNIENALGELERYDLNEALVEIHVGDHYGKYVMERLTCKIKGISEEEYWEKYEGKFEEELWDFDELVEDMDNELEIYAKEFDILPRGVGIRFGWHDGGIATSIHLLEG